MIWRKFYKQTYHGSMYGKGWHIFATWGYCITHMSTDGYVEINAKELSEACGGDIATAQAAIDYLCSPDDASTSTDEGGRRLVQEGRYLYRVVNALKYNQIKGTEGLREYNRQKQKESRARKKERLQIEGSVIAQKFLESQEDRP